MRPRLVVRMNEGLAAGRKLTLISAPAGCGKTTLISEWVANCRLKIDRLRNPQQLPNTALQPSFAWLSLDHEDRDPTRFLAYLVTALQAIVPTLGEGMLAALHASQPPPTHVLLSTLLNEISASPKNFILILDDYHLIDAETIDEALVFLIEHLPPQMHLVITTRQDPDIPLARLRARGQLTELRAADLRFTPSEAAEFLNQVMNLDLSAEDITALETHTEGWITGLQLAALALQGRTDTASFIQSFTGSHRFVLDYLVEEVLQRQPENVHGFLLRTAILERLSAPLCNALTGRKDGKTMLETLERGNLFLVPLDDQRRWYRYHHLFSEVLLAHLLEEHPDQVAALHQRASEWYEQNDLPADAIQHALAAEDWERAAALIELSRPAMDTSYQSAAWLAWAKKLPEALISTRPVLSVGVAWALLDTGEMEACEARLQDAERWQATPSDEMVVVDAEQFRLLPASIAVARAYRALAFADLPETVKYARQALDISAGENHQWRVAALSLLGLTQYASGDLEAAEASLMDFQANIRHTEDILTFIGIAFILAEIKAALGRLHEAISVYQHILQLVPKAGNEDSLVGTSDLYRGLSELTCEQGHLETAEQHLLASKELGRRAVLTNWPQRLCITEARLRESQGDLDEALALLDEAERVYVREPLPKVRPVAALKARVWIKQGRLADAQAWARQRRLSVKDALSYLCEFEHITLARLLVAQHRSDPQAGHAQEAIRLLSRLLQAAETGRRMGSVIEILVMQALAWQAQGSPSEAQQSLARALALAEPQGYSRVFVDEGEEMRSLLAEFRENQPDRRLLAYANKLLLAAGPLVGKQSATSGQKLEMVEALSDREFEVLKLLATELSGPEIARQLTISLNTLRTHTKNIFNKLGANNRRAAVRRAQELGLL